MAGRIGLTPAQQPVIRPRADTQQAERRLQAFAQQQERIFARQSTQRIRAAERAAGAELRADQKTIQRMEAARLKFQRAMEMGTLRQRTRLAQLEESAGKEAAKAQDRLNKQLQKGAGGPRPLFGATGEAIQRFTQKISSAQGPVGRLGATFGVTNTQLSQLLGAGITGSIVVLALRKAFELAAAAAKIFAQVILVSVMAASELREATAAAVASFGPATQTLLDFSRAAEDMGLSMTQALVSARGFQALFRNIGLSRQEAAGLSITFTKLSADIAAFTGAQGGATEVAQRLRRAMAGQLENLDEFGISLRVVDVQNKLMREGLVNTRTEVDSAVLSLGIGREILNRFGDAVGASSREALGFAASSDRFQAALQNLAATAGAAFEPIAAFVVQTATGFVKGLREMIVNVFAFGAALQRTLQTFSILAAKLTILFPLFSLLIEKFVDLGRESFALSKAEAKAAEQAKVDAIKRAVALNRLIQAYDNAADNVIRYAQATLAVRDAELGIEQAQRGIVQAQEQLADARRATVGLTLDLREAEIGLQRARLDQARSGFLVADAEREIRRAREGIVDSQREFIRAQEDLVVAQENLIETQREVGNNLAVREATLRFAEAQLRLKEESLGTARALQEQLDAQLALLDAEFDLERAQRRGRAGARDQLRAIIGIQKAQLGAADAALAPERARISLARATIDAQQAELSLSKALSGESDRKTLRDAERELEDAHIRVRDAARGIEDAHIRLRDTNFALAGAFLDIQVAAISVDRAEQTLITSRIEFERQSGRIRDAELSLATAENAVETAALQAAIAADELKNAEAELSGQTRTTEDRLAFFRGELERLGVKLPEIRGLVDNVRDAINKVPDRKTVDLAIRQEQAQSVVKEFFNEIDRRAKEIADNIKRAFADVLVNLLVKAVTLAVPVTIPFENIIEKKVRELLGVGGERIGSFAVRQHGGPLGMGQTALVGERGPELFVPKTPGFILPANLTAALLTLTRLIAGGQVLPAAGQPPQILNFNAGAFQIPALPDYRALAMAIARELGRRGNR